MDKFPIEVSERLKWYVYRLIDPRNGETFYVGKGRDNRIFQHAAGALSVSEDDEEPSDLKFQRIQHIRAARLEVAHVIHRHGIENEQVALQIEAALIDAYPGLANKVIGHGSGDYGVRHVTEILADYTAEPFEAREPLILISISQSFDDETRGSIYNAVRGCWKLSDTRARNFKLVLGHRHGLVLGAFRPTQWLPATMANFPFLTQDRSGRFGFVGKEAEPEVSNLYVGKRVPDAYRAKGAANPVRFIEP
jgi:hypothetical protein